MRAFFDFKNFKLEEFPYDKTHSALGEYHYLMPKGNYFGFYDPISNHQWRSMDGSWIITENNNEYFLESNRGDVSTGHFETITPLLVYDKFKGSNFIFSTDIIIQGSKKMSGLAFGYIHSRKHYAYVIDDGHLVVYFRNQDEFNILKKIKIDFETLKRYNLKIISKDNVSFYLNDSLMFTLDIKPCGKCAVLSITSAKFTNLLIEGKNISDKKKYDYIPLIKKIDLKNFGSGRQLRFANVDNRPIFVLAQHQKMHARDSFAHISGICCFDIDGVVLWQKGVLDNTIDKTLISCDLPMQIADVDNDGKKEFIYCKDFYLHICDLLTGLEKNKFRLPYVKDDELVGKYPFDYLNCDGLRVCDFEKLGYKGNFIVKDRYKNVYALDQKGNILFRYNHKNTGHFPYVFDFDNDGIDELFIGYDLVKKDKILWSLPIDSDHTDEIIYLNINGENRFLLASGNEGFNIVDDKGNIIKSNDVGHAQRISVAKYDKSVDDLRICVTSFWGANNIIYMFDSKGNLLKEKEFKENGCVITPVYDGKNHYILLNGYLGLCDHNLDIVYKFKEKDRPTLCSEVIDIDDDGVDEIVLWDLNKMYIYKPNSDGVLKKMKKYDENAMSNYRGEFSIE